MTNKTGAHTAGRGKIPAAIAEFQRQYVRLHGYECQPINVRGSWIWACGNPWRCAELLEKARRMSEQADAIAAFKNRKAAATGWTP